MGPGAGELDGRRFRLEVRGVESVVAVHELDDSSDRVAHRAVVATREILERLHQSTRHVPRLGRLDRRVDQALTSRNGVEQELGRDEPRVERVAHKALRGGVLGSLAEVGEGAVLEAVGHPRAGDDLLSDASDHLGDINLGACTSVRYARKRGGRTLGSAGGHDEGRVVAAELRHADLSDLGADLGEHAGDGRLERLVGVGPRLVLELARARLVDELVRLDIRLLDELVLLRSQRRAGRDVADADRESLVGWESQRGYGIALHAPSQRAQSLAILFIAEAASSGP